MAREVSRTEIGHLPELVRLVEAVRASRQPRLLSRDDEPLAVLVPVDRAHSKRGKRAVDVEAFLAAAGGWHDVDTDRLLADIYAERDAADRPPVEL